MYAPRVLRSPADLLAPEEELARFPSDVESLVVLLSWGNLDCGGKFLQPTFEFGVIDVKHELIPPRMSREPFVGRVTRWCTGREDLTRCGFIEAMKLQTWDLTRCGFIEAMKLQTWVFKADTRGVGLLPIGGLLFTSAPGWSGLRMYERFMVERDHWLTHGRPIEYRYEAALL